jgi:predicted GNAT family N-acyltransferase
MIEVKRISTLDPLYEFERKLRNTVLLRPIGLPDNGWEMKDAVSWHFVALKSKQLAGCVVLAPLDSENNRAQLMQMAIATRYQRKGIGKRLVEELLLFAKQEGLKEVMCHSRTDATEFYQKLNFEIYGDEFEEAGVLHNNMNIRIN